MDVFVCEPRNDLLGDRESNEAYCLAKPGKRYAVYFPDGGDVTLDLSDAQGELQVRWRDIENSGWRETERVPAAGTLELKAPGPGHQAVLIQVNEPASETRR